MQIEITGHQLDITDALRRHVGKRLDKLSQHQPPLRHLHVVLQVSKTRHSCDIQTRCGHEEFVAQGSDQDMYSAIDRASEKLERQLQTSKGRKLARRTGHTTKGA